MSPSTRQPDILEVIADLSNDEVRTSPRVVNQVLDLLPEEVWTDETLRWLDPGCKTGSFLREVTRRLLVGLEAKIPDEQERLDHILKNMVFGIAITDLTALMSRRTLYCSKDASGGKSIVKMNAQEGNILLDVYEHNFQQGRCRECGAAEDTFGDVGDSDNHAYAFIHSDARKQVEDKIKLNFDVIIGNPPYQMSMKGKTMGATPLYHLFIETAMALNPRYLAMVVPFRWMVGGLGLDDFRERMLKDKHIRKLVIYPNGEEIFPGPDIKGGISYFLWDRDQEGKCAVSVVRAGEVSGPADRDLDEYDVFIRDPNAVSILRKILGDAKHDSMEDIVSTRNPFGLSVTFEGEETKPPGRAGVRLKRSGPEERWVIRDLVTDNVTAIDSWKVFIPMAGPGNSGGHIIPDSVIGKGEIAAPPSVCTDTYLYIGPLDSKEQSLSIQSYLRTRFARFLISLRKVTQHASRKVYLWVPQQTWDREWTDEELYKKYGITEEEQAYIAEMIKEMPS
jgi:site-specific DNA-methyltransferase (adenine-specific)